MPRLSRSLLAVALVLLPAMVRGEDKDVKIIANATDNERTSRMGPIYLRRDGVVIRNAEELVALSSKPKVAKDAAVQKQMEAELAKLLKVDAIDWNKQMVVGLITEKLESLKTDGKVVTATYVPFKEPGGRAVSPTPKVLLLTDRFEGEVKFVPKK
jgi:hypothetical protein